MEPQEESENRGRESQQKRELTVNRDKGKTLKEINQSDNFYVFTAAAFHSTHLQSSRFIPTTPYCKTQAAEYTVVQRSFSFPGTSFKRSESCCHSPSHTTSNFVAKCQHPNSIHAKLHLTRTHSEPFGMHLWRMDTGFNLMGKSPIRRTWSDL